MSSSGVEGILLGAFLTLVTTVGFRLWQYERERWTSRVDWFCDALDEAANLGVEYWIEAGDGEDRSRDRKREVQILGYQMKLDGMLETFIDKLYVADAQTVRDQLGSFRDALTGGNFQSLGVASDPQRARDVQMTASDVLVKIRTSVDHKIQILPKRFRDRSENY